MIRKAIIVWTFLFAFSATAQINELKKVLNHVKTGEAVIPSDSVPFSIEDNSDFKPYKNSIPSKKQEGYWREIGPTTVPGGPGPFRMRGTGRLVFLEFDEENKRMFTGSPLGGLWYSEDEGDSWRNAGTDYLPEIGVSHLQIAPITNNGETWFITTGDGEGAFNPTNGVWRTTNKGNSWERISNGLDIGDKFPPPYWSRCRKILVHPQNPNILYAAFRHGLYKTENALSDQSEHVVWERVADKELMSEYFDVLFQPGSNGEVVIVSGQKIAVSYSAGAKGSFKVIPKFEYLTKRGVQLISIRMSPADPDRLVGAYAGYVFHYSLKTQLSETYYVGTKYQRHQALAVDPDSVEKIFIGNVRFAYLSRNGGETFLRKPEKGDQFHDDMHWAVFRGNGELWICNDGGIYVSNDDGKNWKNKTNNIGVAIYYNVGGAERLPDLVIGGGWDTGPNIYDAKQDTFRTFKVFGDGFESFIDDTYPDTPIYYVSVQGGILRFDNTLEKAKVAGRPWRIIRGGRNWVHKFVKDPTKQSTIYYAGLKGIGRSMDKAVHWFLVSPNPKEINPNRFYENVWHAPSHTAIVYALLTSKDIEDEDGFALMKSTNANSKLPNDVEWEIINPKISGFEFGPSKDYFLSDLTVDNKDPNRIWVSFSSYNEDIPKVLEYDGKEWKDLTANGLEGQTVIQIQHQQQSGDLLYAGTHSGVYFKKADAKRWTKLHGLPHAKVTDMEINHCAGLLRVSTYGRGIWEMDLLNEFEEIEIVKDEHWQEERVVNQPVIVKEGVSLKISSNISFGINSGIYLEEGAELVVDGAILSNNCNRQWGGVVYYNAVVHQSKPESQGPVLLKNGGQILNARISRY